MTNDKKQPGLPVVEVDQAFPLMTTDGVSRSSASAGTLGDQGPAVTAAIRDVLGWRPRVQDPKAFTAALSASFELSTFEDHVIARYVPRGVAVQADLGGVTGGQASLYLRAKAAHEQITRMLDSLQPLRTDADPQDCEAYRGLVRDSVRRVVMELGREGGPRVPLVDSAFSVLTGYQPSTTTMASTGFTPSPVTGLRPSLAALFNPTTSVSNVGGTFGSVPAANAEIDPDRVPGQLGALRDRFGLDDDHVNTVDEEKQRTSFWTLVELITDLQRSWDTRRLDFTLATGNGFLGTDLVQISRLLAAASEQVDELEAVLDSVLVSPAERQTIVLDRGTGLSLDDLVQWLRVFVTQDGPNIIRDSGRDGLVSSFTPTVVALLLTLRDKLVRRLVPCGGPSCAGGCQCGSRGQVTCIPLGCCTPLPPGMYAGRVKIAVSTLCGLVERLTGKAIRIGRFAGAVLLDLSVVPFETVDSLGAAAVVDDVVRVEVRGLHLRPTYLLAFVADGGNPANIASLVLPLQGSASADTDHLSGIFQRGALPNALQTLLTNANGRGVLMAASEVPLAVIDGELGRVVQGPTVTTWPRLQPAGVVSGDGDAELWDEIDPNQRFVPQDPPDPVDPEVPDECLDDCGEDCEGCGCGCHPLDTVRRGLDRVRRVVGDPEVTKAAEAVEADLRAQRPPESVAELLRLFGTNSVAELLEVIGQADRRGAESLAAEIRRAEVEAEAAARVRQAEARAKSAEDQAERARAAHERAATELQSVRENRAPVQVSTAEEVIVDKLHEPPPPIGIDEFAPTVGRTPATTDSDSEDGTTDFGSDNNTAASDYGSGGFTTSGSGASYRGPVFEDETSRVEASDLALNDGGVSDLGGADVGSRDYRSGNFGNAVQESWKDEPDPTSRTSEAQAREPERPENPEPHEESEPGEDLQSDEDSGGDESLEPDEDSDQPAAEAPPGQEPDDDEPHVPARSEREATTLEELRAFVANQNGRLESIIKDNQDRIEIRRFVVAALRSAETGTRADGKDD